MNNTKIIWTNELREEFNQLVEARENIWNINVKKIYPCCSPS